MVSSALQLSPPYRLGVNPAFGPKASSPTRQRLTSYRLCATGRADGGLSARRHRSPERNRAIGGVTRRKDLGSAAFDIAMSTHDPLAFTASARKVGFLGFGFHPRSGQMPS